MSQKEVQRNPLTPPPKHRRVSQMNVSGGARERRLNDQLEVQSVQILANISADLFKFCQGEMT